MLANQRPAEAHQRRPDPARGIAAGLAGGLFGSLAMAAVQGIWSAAIGPRSRPAEHDVAGDFDPLAGPEPSTVRAVRSLLRGLGRDLPDRHARPAGRAFHYAFGTGLGGIYGLLAEYVGLVTIGAGVPFATLQVAFADELSVPALGLSGEPSRAPASAHVRSLAAHAAFGLVSEWVRRRVRAWL